MLFLLVTFIRSMATHHTNVRKKTRFDCFWVITLSIYDDGLATIIFAGFNWFFASPEYPSTIRVTPVMQNIVRNMYSEVQQHSSVLKTPFAIETHNKTSPFKVIPVIPISLCRADLKRKLKLLAMFYFTDEFSRFNGEA